MKKTVLAILVLAAVCSAPSAFADLPPACHCYWCGSSLDYYCLEGGTLTICGSYYVRRCIVGTQSGEAAAQAVPPLEIALCSAAPVACAGSAARRLCQP